MNSFTTSFKAASFIFILGLHSSLSSLFGKLSSDTSAERAFLRAVGYSTEERATEKKIVTASDYAFFLNSGAATDTDYLYNEKMASDAQSAYIIRLGTAGNYSYEVLAGRESLPVRYINWVNQTSYCHWRQNNAQGRVSRLSEDLADACLSSVHHDFCLVNDIFLLSETSSSSKTGFTWEEDVLFAVAGACLFKRLFIDPPARISLQGQEAEREGIVISFATREQGVSANKISNSTRIVSSSTVADSRAAGGSQVVESQNSLTLSGLILVPSWDSAPDSLVSPDSQAVLKNMHDGLNTLTKALRVRLEALEEHEKLKYNEYQQQQHFQYKKIATLFLERQKASTLADLDNREKEIRKILAHVEQARNISAPLEDLWNYKMELCQIVKAKNMLPLINSAADLENYNEEYKRQFQEQEKVSKHRKTFLSVFQELQREDRLFLVRQRNSMKGHNIADLESSKFWKAVTPWYQETQSLHNLSVEAIQLQNKIRGLESATQREAISLIKFFEDAEIINVSYEAEQLQAQLAKCHQKINEQKGKINAVFMALKKEPYIQEKICWWEKLLSQKRLSFNASYSRGQGQVGENSSFVSNATADDQSQKTLAPPISSKKSQTSFFEDDIDSVSDNTDGDKSSRESLRIKAIELARSKKILSLIKRSPSANSLLKEKSTNQPIKESNDDSERPLSATELKSPVVNQKLFSRRRAASVDVMTSSASTDNKETFMRSQDRRSSLGSEQDTELRGELSKLLRLRSVMLKSQSYSQSPPKTQGSSHFSTTPKAHGGSMRSSASSAGRTKGLRERPPRGDVFNRLQKLSYGDLEVNTMSGTSSTSGNTSIESRTSERALSGEGTTPDMTLNEVENDSPRTPAAY